MATRLVGWPLVVSLIAYAILLGGTYPGVFAPDFRIVNVAFASIVLAAAIGLAILRPAWREASVLWPALLAIVVALGLAGVTSVLPGLSAEYVAYALVLIGLYLVLRRFQADPWIGPRLGAVAIILLGLIVVLYLRTTIALWLDWWGLVGRLALPPLRPGFESLAFGNPSALAATTVLLFVTGAAHVGTSTRSRSAVVVGLFLVTGFVVLVSGARSAWLGFGVMIAVVTIAWILGADRRSRLRAGLATTTGRVAAIGVAMAGLSAAAILAPAVLVRVGMGDPFRPGYWMASLRMFADAPVTGQGPGTWASQRASFTGSTDLDFTIPHGHNVVLQTLAELGLVGAVAGVVVVVVVGRLILRSMQGDAEQHRYARALIAGIGYLAGHQLVDVVTNLPAVLLAFALPLARLDALDRTEAVDGSADRSRRFSTGLLVAAVVASVALWPSTLLSVRHDDAVDAANDGDWTRAAAISREVATTDPGMPAYRVTLGLALARTGAPDEAIAAFLAAGEVDEWPQSWLDAAALLAAGGRPDEADAALTTALRLGGQQPAITLAAARVALAMGARDRARSLVMTTLQSAPSIAADPWWDGQPELREMRDAAADQVIDHGGVTGLRVALELGRLAEAESIAALFAGEERVVVALALAAWRDDGGARAALEAAAVAEPLDAGIVAWNAIVADHHGDRAARNRFVRWAELINGGAGLESVGYRIVDPLGPGQVPTGTFGLSYGQYLYLRPVPRDELVPGLPQLVYR